MRTTSCRILPLFLAAVLAAAFFTGCQEHKNKEKQQSVQQQLGQKAAESVERPVDEARKAVELQQAATERIKATDQQAFENK